jgi:chromosome segregation ATPase
VLQVQGTLSRSLGLAVQLCGGKGEGTGSDSPASLAASQAHLTELELLVHTLKTESATAQEQLAALRGDLAAAQAARQQERSAAGEARQHAAQLQEALARATAAREALQAQVQAEVQARRSDKAWAAEQLSGAQQEQSSGRAVLAMAQGEHNARHEQLRTQLQETQQALKERDRQLAQRERDAQLAQRARDDTAAALTELQVGQRACDSATRAKCHKPSCFAAPA